MWLIFKLTRPPAQVVGLQVPVPVPLAYQSVVAVVAVAWRRIRRPLDRRSGSAFHRHIDHLGHSQHHIHCARFGLDHILLASWQPAHHNQHIQLLRPEETSEAFYHQQKEENFSEEKQIWWSCFIKKHTEQKLESELKIMFQSLPWIWLQDASYQMSIFIVHMSSERTTSSAPAGSFWLAPGRPAENYVDRTMCSWGSLIQIEVPSNIKASLSASACLWHSKNPDPSWLNRIGGRTIPSLG